METLSTIFRLKESELIHHIHCHNHTNFLLNPLHLCPNTIICFTQIGQPFHYINYQQFSIQLGGLYYLPAHNNYFLPPHPDTKFIAYTFPWFQQRAYQIWSQGMRYVPDKFIPKSQLLPLVFSGNPKNYLHELLWFLQRLPVPTVIDKETAVLLMESNEFINVLYKKHTPQYSDIHIPTIAKKLNMSERQVFRICKHIFHTSPASIYNSHLLAAITRYIYEHPEKSLWELAEHFGFKNESDLIRFFKKETGMTTTQFKKMVF